MGKHNKKQVQAYDHNLTERLRNVTLPAKLKCNMCEKNYNSANFSQKQLDGARYQILKTNKIMKNPRCIKCNGQQVVEIECVVCYKTKGLEQFANSQSKDKGTARCFKCTDELVTRTPVCDKVYEEPGKAFIKTKTSGQDDPEYWSIANSTPDTASSNGDWGTTESSNGSRSRNQGGGIALAEDFEQTLSFDEDVFGTLIDSGSSCKPNNGERPRPYESAQTASWHTLTSTPSSSRSGQFGAPSTSGSMRSFPSSIAERSQSSHPHIEMRNGFAKIRASETETDDQWSRSDRRDDSPSDSDGDDSDDDDGDDDEEYAP